MANFRGKLLVVEIALFLAIQLIGIWVGIRLPQIVDIPARMETTYSIAYFLVAFLIATALIILALKYLKGKTAFGALFGFLIVIGADTVFETFLPGAIALGLAVFIAALRFWKPSVLVHNIAIVLAVAGVGAQLGLALTIPAIIVLLIALSIYDYIAVFRTKHMVKMFSSLTEKGLPLSIVVSENLGSWAQSMKDVGKAKIEKKSKDFMMLGTGDLAFPLVFAVAALEHHIFSAFAVVAGSVVGIIAIHTLMMQGKIRAMPALPPLAIASIIAFGISYLLV